MGFFSLKAVCAVCNKETGLNRYQIANKEWICHECLKKCGFGAFKLTPIPVYQMTPQYFHDILNAKKTVEENLKSFNTTKKIGTFMELDDNQKKLVLARDSNPLIYKYADIVDFELLENGESIVKGGLGRAIAGGVLLGGVGAIVGGMTGGKTICNSLKIKITVNNIDNPLVYLYFIDSTVDKNSIIYKELYDIAQLCMSTLQLICNSIEESKQDSNTPILSGADEILKYKNLLDGGIITQEEFDAKKKQLLGL